MTRTRNDYVMAYRQEQGQPWIGLPAVQNDGTKSNEEMIADAGLLNWDVRLTEVTPEVVGMDEDGNPVTEQVDTPSYKVMRTHPDTGLPHRLAIVGNRYHEVQNEALIAMADNITGGENTLVAAGNFDGGRRVFLSFELGENVVLDPEGQADEIGRYMTVLAGHDGSLGISFNTHDMRLRCQNMLNSIRKSALGSFKMRHTQNVEGRILAARKALSIAVKADDEFQKEMQALMDVQVSDVRFQKIVETIHKRPEKDVKGSLAKWEHKIGLITSLWNGPTLDNLDNTAYKAYNALNEHLRWYPTIRAGNVESALVKASGFDEKTEKDDLALYKAVLLAVA